jgi:hypothetical protein
MEEFVQGGFIADILELPEELKPAFEQKDAQVCPEISQDKANALTARVKSNLRIPDK